LEEIAADSPAASIQQAQELLLEYGRFVAAKPDVATFCFGALEQEAAGLPHSYLDQGGGILLARVAGKPLGLVTWRTLPAAKLAISWEMKRLWIRPEARGLGLGRSLVQAVVDRAAKAEKNRIVLDTAPEAMPAAYHLYFEMGFTTCPPYNGPAMPGIAYLSRQIPPR
jgi:GNAT superfamily N-acetyltransferase